MPFQEDTNKSKKFHCTKYLGLFACCSMGLGLCSGLGLGLGFPVQSKQADASRQAAQGNDPLFHTYLWINMTGCFPWKRQVSNSN